MKIQCDYCGEEMDDSNEKCPFCGAENTHYRATNVEQFNYDNPKTIEELRQWYENHNLPPENVTRFFIGKDYKEPKAFGIYQDGERFIVYKNKADGSRAIRYDGKDEAHAVNELFLKLKERIAEEKAKNGKGKRKNKGKPSLKSRIEDSILYIVITGFIIWIVVILAMKIPNQGYYSYMGDTYYYLDNWYIYDIINSCWNYTTVDSELEKNYDDYFESKDYYSSYDVSDFEDTSYYSTWEASQDSDSDSYWDSGDSWDSGGGDWDSDW